MRRCQTHPRRTRRKPGGNVRPGPVRYSPAAARKTEEPENRELKTFRLRGFKDRADKTAREVARGGCAIRSRAPGTGTGCDAAAVTHSIVAGGGGGAGVAAETLCAHRRTLVNPEPR